MAQPWIHPLRITCPQPCLQGAVYNTKTKLGQKSGGVHQWPLECLLCLKDPDSKIGHQFLCSHKVLYLFGDRSPIKSQRSCNKHIITSKENLRITSHWTELPTGKLEPSTTTQPPHPSTQTVQHPTKSGYKIQETSQLYLWGTSMHIPFQYLNQIAHSSTTTSTFAIIFLSMHDHHSWLQVHYFFNIYFKYNVMLEWSWVIKS